MYELWEFLRKNAKKIVIFGGIILLCLFIGFMFDRKDLHDNGESINGIRNELDQAEGAKQDIAGTTSDIKNTSTKLENAIGTASDASSNFESIIDECQSIIEQIRKQPTE